MLVDRRERLRTSTRPNQIFEVGLQPRTRRLLAGPDSTPPDDAVATMDTVPLIRSAVRGVLEVADTPLRSSELTQPERLAAHRSSALGPHLARPAAADPTPAGVP